MYSESTCSELTSRLDYAIRLATTLAIGLVVTVVLLAFVLCYAVRAHRVAAEQTHALYECRCELNRAPDESEELGVNGVRKVGGRVPTSSPSADQQFDGTEEEEEDE